MAERSRFLAWGTRGGAKKDKRRSTAAFGMRRVKSLGNLELGRRIEEDTAIVRAVSVCCGEDPPFAYGGGKVYNNGDISRGLYGGSEEKSLCRNERDQQSDRAAVV